MKSWLGPWVLELFTWMGIVMGVLNLVFGYGQLKRMFLVIGFVIGSTTSLSMVGYFGFHPTFSFLLAGFVGIVTGLLFFAGHFLLRFTWGPGLAYLLAFVTSILLNISHPHFLFPTILVNIGIILAFVYRRHSVILGSAFLGSWWCVTGIYYLLVRPIHLMLPLPKEMAKMLEGDARGELFVLLACWLVIGVIGAVTQYFVTGIPESPQHLQHEVDPSTTTSTFSLEDTQDHS